jgi:hypothetical protein
MKDAAVLPHPTHHAVSAQPMNTAILAEASIHPHRNGCSPRANIAFAALDAVRSIVACLSRLLPAAQAVDLARTHPKGSERRGAVRTRRAESLER